MDRAARRTREAAQRARRSRDAVHPGRQRSARCRPLPALLDQLREAFGFTGVSLLERRPDRPAGPGAATRPWRIAAAVGDQPCLAPAQGDAEIPVDENLTLVLRGHPLAAADRRVVEAFAAQAAVALRQERLAEQAAAVGPLAEVDKLRTALLSAVSHDLRTPLASAKAAVNGLRSHDVVFSEADRDELLATVEESLDRLTRLVDNLLDMSRLQAGALGLAPQAMSIAETIAKALDDLGPAGRDVVPRTSPTTHPRCTPTRPSSNGSWSTSCATRCATARPDNRRSSPSATTPDTSRPAIIDHGPGIPAEQWDRVFLPFQRLGDRDNDTGVGLGLALSRGLAEAMGGSLTPDDHPGGGLTMTLRLPAGPTPARRRRRTRPDPGRGPGTPRPDRTLAARR